MDKWKKFLIPVVILALGFFSMQALSRFGDEPPKNTPTVRKKIVEAAVVTLRDTPANITAYGRLASAQPVVLYSEVEGQLLTGSVPFQPAQAFKRGDLLLEIDDRQTQLDLNSAKSDFLNALALVLPEIKVDFPEKFAVWEKYFNESGFDRDLQPLPEVENQRIKLFLSRFNVYKLYFNIRDLEIRLAKHKIYAPFDGSIVAADLRIGSTARNGTRLGEIINIENLEVEVPIPAEDVRWIDRSQKVRLTSSELPGQWQGAIRRIGQKIDTRTQSVQVFIGIDAANRQGLFSGVFMKAVIPGIPVPEAAIVPQRALYQGTHVYLVKEGKLDYRSIAIARSETDYVIVSDGIADGDTLVTEPLVGVAPGMQAAAVVSTESEVANK